MNIEIYKDAKATEILKDLGDIDLYTTREIPIFIKNIGSTRLVGVEIESTYPDTKIVNKSYTFIESGQIVKSFIVWSPGEQTMQIFKSGNKRSGGLVITAKEVIE